MGIRTFEHADFTRVCEIIAASGLRTQDLKSTRMENYCVATEEGRIVGVAGMDRGEHVGLVRSLAVDPPFRKLGIGNRLYHAVEAQARHHGLLRLCLLTTTARQFFERLGYQVMDRDLAPLPIRRSDQFQTLCPQSAVLMQKSLRAAEGRTKFDSGLYCAESVVAAVAERYGIESDWLPGIATGLCSGMGRTCGTCGAVSGGVLALNLLLGRRSATDSVDGNYAAVQALLGGFADLYGTTNCAELLGCDLGTAEGQSTFSGQQLHRRCREFTDLATDLAIRILEDRNQRQPPTDIK